MPEMLSRPLEIGALKVLNGHVGLTQCPGQRAGDRAGPRDLDADISAIKAWGADIVISLLEAPEFELLGVAGLPGKLSSAFDWHHLPIRDMQPPDARFERAWKKLAPRVVQCLADGGRVLLHCRGGLGRSGTVAARILIEQGESATRAMARVRAARPGAIETRGQEAFLGNLAMADPGAVARRIEASLLAGAIGDALGAEIEFWPLARIRQAFPEGFDALPQHCGLAGAITDDTQMTLFTAEGLVDAFFRMTFKGICHVPSMVHHALLRWYMTQGGAPLMGVDRHGLVADPRLHARRAPGTTCLSALGSARNFGDSARNNSKGCGTIMRVAPVALCGASEVARLAVECSALTHGHPTAQQAAAAWALILSKVFRGTQIAEAVRACRGQFDENTEQALAAAVHAPRDGMPETVETLGAGWVAEEALAIGLYACLCATTFQHGLTMAVTHSGDSDSTGAIAGNMLGLLFPDQVFASDWASEVECRDLISQQAHNLAACAIGRPEILTRVDPRR